LTELLVASQKRTLLHLLDSAHVIFKLCVSVIHHTQQLTFSFIF